MWNEDEQEDMSDWLREAYKKTPNAIKSPLDGCISISNNAKIQMSFIPNKRHHKFYNFNVTPDNTANK